MDTKARNSKLPVEKWRFDTTDPLFCRSVKEQCIFVDLLQIEEEIPLPMLSQLLYMGCPLMREHKQEKCNFHSQKYRPPLTRECLLTEMCKYRV